MLIQGSEKKWTVSYHLLKPISQYFFVEPGFTGKNGLNRTALSLVSRKKNQFLLPVTFAGKLYSQILATLPKQ